MARTILISERDGQVAVGIGSGIRLRLNSLSAEAAVEQLVRHGRLTLPNTVEVVILPDNGGTKPSGGASTSPSQPSKPGKG